MKQETWSKVGKWVETTAETAELISAFFELADVVLTAGWNLFHREGERIEPVEESSTIRHAPRRKWEGPEDEWQAWWESKRARDREKEEEEFRAFILHKETSNLDRRYKERMSDPTA